MATKTSSKTATRKPAARKAAAAHKPPASKARTSKKKLELDAESAGAPAKPQQPPSAKVTAEVAPAPRHEPAMPAHQRVGRDQSACARGAARRPGTSGRRTEARAAQPGGGDLVTQDDDLELLELLGATGEHGELKQASQGDVEQ